MRQVIYAFCAAVLAMMTYIAVPAAVTAEPTVQNSQVAPDNMLQKVQYGGGYRDYDRNDAPPPPPPHRKKLDPGWSNDGQPRFRSDRFTKPYCEECRYICNGERECPKRCWGWKRYCHRHY
jgi:hypothetical protein